MKGKVKKEQNNLLRNQRLIAKLDFLNFAWMETFKSFGEIINATEDLISWFGLNSI